MNMRQRLRRWLGIDDLYMELNELRDDLSETQFIAGTAQARHDSLRREVEELGVLATATKDALGENEDWADRHNRNSLRGRVRRLEEVTLIHPRGGPLNVQVVEPGDEQILLSALFRALLSRER